VEADAGKESTDVHPTGLDVRRAASDSGADAVAGLAVIRKQVDALEALLVARGGDVRAPGD
jgi:hypothetical protein